MKFQRVLFIMEETMGDLKINTNQEENLINRMQKQMENLYENVRGLWPHGTSYFSSPFKMMISPRINIMENGSHYTVSAELPGVDKDDININVENDILSIAAEKKYDKTEEAESFYHVEHGYGLVKRSIKIPEHIDKESIEAEYNNGLLIIKIAKLDNAESNKKSINIK